ncbi:hypothetical protein [Sphingomonas sp. DC2300-3]|uniref:hypothetical protein n=1 Tax=unclassified Sphingomonas TaxID=196159 RepID=UPI003CFAE258
MRKRLAVLTAVKAMIVAALPGADVRGMDADDAKPTRVSPTGMVIVRSGDPGTPDVDLSPATYWWDHRIPIEMAGYQSTARTYQEVLDDMIAAVDLAIQANRTLGGLCIYLDAEPPSDGEIDKTGAVPVGWADFAIIASYSTDSPLG